MERPIILSLFDATGNWSRPYREAGYDVRQYDLTLGHDLLEIPTEHFIRISLEGEIDDQVSCVQGVLAAPPCTDFASSGAQYWKTKDDDGRTAHSIALIRKTLEIITWCEPIWWALENPVGRLNTCVPALAKYGPWYWQPFWYGDAYTKKTGLWGTFTRPQPTQMVEPERTKALRSATPMGFARAFFAVNP